MGVKGVKVIAFDADDTLWDCQSYYEAVERGYCRMLSPYGDSQTIAESLFHTETSNMRALGYGTKAFIISLIETAVKVSGGKITGEGIGEITALGRSLLDIPATPLPGVRETLYRLRGRRLVVFTKGELLDQENKLRRSGLGEFFEREIIVSDKTEREYRALCERLCVRPSELMMVGNSFRSDVMPAVAIGAYAIHVPSHAWRLEESGTFTHERIVTVKTFADITDVIG